jgi:hypothetical protein
VVESIARSVVAPEGAPFGTTNRHTNVPVLEVVMVEPENVQVLFELPEGVIPTPPRKSATPVEGTNPAPRTVAVDRVRPDVGPTTIVAGVKVVVPVLVPTPPTVAVAVTLNV